MDLSNEGCMDSVHHNNLKDQYTLTVLLSLSLSLSLPPPPPPPPPPPDTFMKLSTFTL